MGASSPGPLTSGADERPLALDGLWSRYIEENVCPCASWLVIVCRRDENVIFLLEYSPVLCDVTVKDEWVGSPESIRHVSLAACVVEQA